MNADKERQRRDLSTVNRHAGSHWAPQAVLVALLVGSVLPIGSVHWLVICAVCGLGCLGVAWGGRALQDSWNRVSTVCTALAIWTILTVIPLPPGVTELFAAKNAELWTNGLAPLQAPSPRSAPLSLDPIASTLEVAKWTLYACTALLAAHVARVRGLTFILAAVWSSAVLVALITTFQAAAGLTSVLGLYEPLRVAHGETPSVLINPNNLAGYCNLGAFCGAGLMGTRRRTLPRSVILVGLIICVATTVFSGSRAGVLTLVLGMCALLIRWGARSVRKEDWASPARDFRSWALVVAVVSLTGLVVLAGGTHNMWKELLNDDLSKLRETATLVPAVRTHFWVGVGRGAFETVSFLYFDDPHPIVRRSVENFATSWVIEWGAPVALAALVQLGWLLRPSRMHLRESNSAQAAYAGVLVLIGQNFVDLGLEVVSVTVAGFTLFGALEGSRIQRATRTSQCSTNRSISLQSLRYASRVVPLVGIAAAVAAASSGPSVYELRPLLSREIDHMVDDAKNMGAIEERLARAMKFRPAEHYFPLLGTRAALSVGADALPWAAEALRRAPWNARAHFVVAEALLQKGVLQQAMIHFRHAASGDRELLATVTTRIIDLTQDQKLILSATPRDLAGPFLLGVVGKLDREEHYLLRRQLLWEARKRAPDDMNVKSTLAFALFADLKTGTFPCAAPGGACPLADVAGVKETVQTLATELGDDPKCAGLRLQSHLLAFEGEAEKAGRQMRACNRCRQPVACAKDRVYITSDQTDVELRKEAEGAYVALACSRAESCADAERFIGDRAADRGDWLAAYTHYVRAAGRDPTRENWLAATRAALVTGRLVQAQAAYDHVKSLGGKDKRTETLFGKARQDNMQRASPGARRAFP